MSILARMLVGGINWCTKLANQGYAAGQYTLGTMYFNGEAAPQDREKSIDFFKAAASQGHTGAQ